MRGVLVAAVLLAIASVTVAGVAADPFPFPVERTALYAFYHNKVDSITRDGVVTVAELQRFVDQMDPDESGVLPPLARVEAVHRRYDTNGDGAWTWDEFVARFARLLRADAYAADAPQEQHLSMTADSTQMLVSWAQQTYTPTPTVQYGTDPNALSLTATGSSHNYSLELVTGPWHSMQLNVVLLTGLAPATQYFYRVGGNDVGWGNVTAFRSAPDVTSVPDRITWAVYGDMGTVVPLGYEVTNELVAANAADPFDLVLHVGDLAYAGVSSESAGEWEPTWDVWMNQIEPLASVVPYQVSVGNHEKYYEYAAFINRFDMPGPQTNGNGSFWWSFDFGSVHLTSFSTENDFSVGSEQYQWIEADLRAARQRPNLRWLFVSGHRPFLSSDKSEYNTHQPNAPMIASLGPLFEQYGVDMVFTGHMHCYERTYPVFANGTIAPGVHAGQNSYTNPQAPVYIVQGNAGAMVLETWIDPQPLWSANRQQLYGFGRVTLMSYANGTDALQYQSMSGGKTVDELFIYHTH